jgi:CheY-like chemotaxis protein
MRVLLVEDNDDLRTTMAFVLGRSGYDVDTAENGRKALDQLKAGPRPGAILLDLMMPVMDGWQFRRAQKDDPALADIPVIVLSAASRLSEEAASLDAADYLHKPVDFGQLRVMLRRCEQGAGPWDSTPEPHAAKSGS